MVFYIFDADRFERKRCAFFREEEEKKRRKPLYLMKCRAMQTNPSAANVSVGVLFHYFGLFRLDVGGRIIRWVVEGNSEESLKIFLYFFYRCLLILFLN